MNCRSWLKAFQRKWVSMLKKDYILKRKPLGVLGGTLVFYSLLLWLLTFETERI